MASASAHTNPNLRVLIVEDNRDIADNIGDYLGARGHVVDYAFDGACGLELALSNDYDVLILDRMLPRLDGTRVCKRLRAQGKGLPVLMLTARDTVPDKLEGFDAGADDYVTKPFALQELEARLQALARRAKPNAGSVLRVADLELDLGTLEVRRAGRRLELNPASLKVLTELMRASPNVVTKSRLEVVLWGDEPSGPDALRAQMYALRQVIDKPFDVALLRTVHGIGYRLVDPHEEATA